MIKIKTDSHYSPRAIFLQIKTVSLGLDLSRLLILSIPELFSVVLIKEMLLRNSYIHKESITIMNKTPLYKNLNK